MNSRPTLSRKPRSKSPKQCAITNACKINGLVKEVEHARIGKLKTAGIGPKFSETPLDIRMPPPDLGEHNSVILSGLGYSEDDIAALREQGALG
jgi:crotonobetainyl-CoA:carnitine CoA-transferase CaiB-like acyl-CoA transferase